jgi:hypothetical protein
MRLNSNIPVWRFWPVLAVALLALPGVAARGHDLKFEAYLVWATNAEKSPDPRHKPVNSEVRKKLEDLPLKWTHFYEVSREKFSVPRGGSEGANLSEKCRIQVTDVGMKHIEVSLIGKGEPVLKRTQPLAKGELLVLGGNAPDDTGWLVVLKRIE